MEKISINLLPVEVTKAQLTQSKYYKITSISVFITLAMFFLASTAIALRILQNKNIQEAQFSLQAAEDKVTSYKGAETSLVILKNRLDNIDQLQSVPSKQRAIYNLVSNLIPGAITINAVSVDSSGNLELALITKDSVILNNLLEDFVNGDKNQGLIVSVEVESLTRDRDGLYRANLRVKAK